MANDSWGTGCSFHSRVELIQLEPRRDIPHGLLLGACVLLVTYINIFKCVCIYIRIYAILSHW
jgi:hypothetical protein